MDKNNNIMIKPSINTLKLISPDFPLGKMLTFIRAIFDLITFILAYPSLHSLRLAGIIVRVKPNFTMVTTRNLISLYSLARRVEALGIPGDIVECGVWNGGSAAVMGHALNSLGNRAYHRNIWLFDSFQGLPLPGEKDGDSERDSYFDGWCKGDQRKVAQAFGMLGVPTNNVEIIPGWFESTLETASIRNISILHIDADWYDSIKIVMDTFYERVAPGGFIILNDYGYWKGCERAVADYFTEHGITNIIINQVDQGGAYFQKPGA
jgi:O-methyltransferase